MRVGVPKKDPQPFFFSFLGLHTFFFLRAVPPHLSQTYRGVSLCLPFVHIEVP